MDNKEKIEAIKVKPSKNVDVKKLQASIDKKKESVQKPLNK